MNTHPPFEGTVPLTHWGLLRAKGPEAVKFLQGQLTNDVESLSRADARLAGFCSAKGRLQASFVIWKPADDEVLLACSASLLAVTLKRLSMFVLRAKCKLSDASAELALHGVVGTSARTMLAEMPVWGQREVADGTAIRVPDVDGVPRAMVASPLADPYAMLPALPLDTWRWLEVRSGIPMIEAPTFEQFVPQMLNYELIGGVDFKKGCYPGQEIVARSQYRGTIKRRMFLFECAGQASSGQEVFPSSDAEQPAGMVVNAAPNPSGAGSTALIEVKLAALESAELHLGASGGPLLHLGVMPYPVPAEAAQAS